MSTPPLTSLPSFVPSDFKFTQPPNPSWTFGQPFTATEQGKKWAEDEREGWKTSIDASEEDPRMIYAMCTSGIVPRPVAFVSTIAEDGTENLAPFRYYLQSLRYMRQAQSNLPLMTLKLTALKPQVSTNPPIISVSFTGSPRHKDSGNNIRATKGFTVNIISEPWIAQANSCAIDAPPNMSEWALSGLTREPSVFVKPARVKESAFSLECELLQNVEVKNADGGVAVNLVLGAIKYIHVRKAVLNDRGLVDPAKLKPIARLGDTGYATLGNGFRIPRHSWAKDEAEIQKNLNISFGM
ncbi:hypothetical protein B0H11DRAFT_2179326 [Mycena galericulata]|nr:hypothetical protein B0H11DRAFT_2179326 [Mycena galericulata]